MKQGRTWQVALRIPSEQGNCQVVFTLHAITFNSIINVPLYSKLVRGENLILLAKARE